MDPEIRELFAAAVDTVLPGSASKGVHERVFALFDGVMPGFPIVVAGLLDAFASDVRKGAKFIDLNDEDRSLVFKLMMEDPSVDIRDAIDGVMLFTLGQNYVETDPDHRATYARIGYRGSSEGFTDYA